MKVRREARKKVCLELTLKRVDASKNSKLARQGIPATRSVVGKSTFSQCSVRSKRTCGQLHVQRTSKGHFFGKKGRSRAVNTAKDKYKSLEVKSLLNG